MSFHRLKISFFLFLLVCIPIASSMTSQPVKYYLLTSAIVQSPLEIVSLVDGNSISAGTTYNKFRISPLSF